MTKLSIHLIKVFFAKSIYEKFHLDPHWNIFHESKLAKVFYDGIFVVVVTVVCFMPSRTRILSSLSGEVPTSEQRTSNLCITKRKQTLRLEKLKLFIIRIKQRQFFLLYEYIQIHIKLNSNWNTLNIKRQRLFTMYHFQQSFNQLNIILILTASEVLLGLLLGLEECEFELWRALWLCEFSCGE